MIRKPKLSARDQAVVDDVVEVLHKHRHLPPLTMELLMGLAFDRWVAVLRKKARVLPRAD